MCAHDLLKLFRILPVLDMEEVAYTTARRKAFPQFGMVAVEWLTEILAKPTTTIPLAGKAIGLSRNAAYQAASRGEIPTLCFGKRKLVLTAWLRQILRLSASTDDGHLK